MIFHIYKFLSNPILAPSQVGQVTQQRGLRGLEAPIRTSEATVGGVVVFRWFFDSNEKWNMGVSTNGGTPESFIYRWIFPYKPIQLLGYPHLWKPTYVGVIQ
jgi:hypothetical protein